MTQAERDIRDELIGRTIELACTRSAEAGVEPWNAGVLTREYIMGLTAMLIVRGVLTLEDAFAVMEAS